MSADLTEIDRLGRSGQFEQAEKLLQQGLQEHPNSALGQYYYAQVEAHLNHWSAAQTALGRAEQIDPTDSFAHDLSKLEALKSKLGYSQIQTAPVVTYQEQQPVSPYVAAPQKYESSGFGWSVFLIILAANLGFFFYHKKKKAKIKAELEHLKDEKEKLTRRLKADVDAFNSSEEKEQSANIKAQVAFANEKVAQKEYAQDYPRPLSSVPPPQYYASHPGPVVIHDNSGPGFGTGLMAGVLMDEVLNSRHSEKVIEKEVTRDTPVYRETESERDPSSSSKTSDTSSWDSGSSSSSSWDSGSSSSWDSGSSSSWDSGSSSSSSSW